MAEYVSLVQLQAVLGGSGSGISINVSMVQLQVVYGGIPPYDTAAYLASVIHVSMVQLQVVLGPGSSSVRAALVQLQVVLPVYEQPPVVIFPTLVGLGWNVVKRPIWGTSIATAASGGEVQTSYYQYPIWEFDLTYDILNDEQTLASTTASDFRTLIGFYNSMYGNLMKFAFQDPDDNTVVGQVIGTGDGVTKTFVLCRFFGLGTNGLLEPIGVLNQGVGVPFNVYVNGALQSESAYIVNTVQPVNQTITFVTAPAAGLPVAVDMSYYFWVRFLDGQYDFEKFTDVRWMLRKLTLHSQRH
jgi:uncharacterized protein (TIGR02217 family)